MAWQVEILGVEPMPENRRNIQARARFYKGPEEIVDRIFAHDLTLDRVTEWARANLDVLNSRDAAMASLQGAVGPLDVPPLTDQQLTEKAELADMLDKLATLQALKRQAENGIIAPNSQAIVDAQAALVAAWRPQFSGKTPAG